MASAAKVKEIKEFVAENGVGDFTIPDNCPGDGWDGILGETGAYCYGDNHFGGEFFKYEDMDDELIDTILNEANFECISWSLIEE